MTRGYCAATCLLVLLAGCREPAAPPGTGAETAARGYYEALMRQDWAGAYAALHPDSKAKVTAARFTRQAENYRFQLGFAPELIAIRSCEEHGAEAFAHVVLKGGTRAHKDAIVLRQSPTGWGVVLPPRFGDKR